MADFIRQDSGTALAAMQDRCSRIVAETDCKPCFGERTCATASAGCWMRSTGRRRR